MIRNSKPKIEHLTEELLTKLQEMGFCKYYDSCNRKIDKVNTKAFYKPYHCCGGTFKLAINIERAYRSCSGKDVKPYVKIDTPYDSWWGKSWDLSEFTKEMENFQIQLANDMKELRKLGIIS